MKKEEEMEVTCFIDDEQVDCETWGEPIAKAEAEEIESQQDFLSQYDS